MRLTKILEVIRESEPPLRSLISKVDAVLVGQAKFPVAHGRTPARTSRRKQRPVPASHSETRSQVDPEAQVRASVSQVKEIEFGKGRDFKIDRVSCTRQTRKERNLREEPRIRPTQKPLVL